MPPERVSGPRLACRDLEDVLREALIKVEEDEEATAACSA